MGYPEASFETIFIEDESLVFTKNIVWVLGSIGLLSFKRKCGGLGARESYIFLEITT